ncbi:hypothetical protein D3C85_1481340 [compost metagenome]
MPVEVGEIGVAHLKTDVGHRHLCLQQQPAGALNPELAHEIDEAMTGNSFEEARKPRLAHVQASRDDR